MGEHTALLSCPFCGGEPVNRGYRSCDCCGKAYTGIVSCTKCEAEVSHRDTDAEAVAAWNTRTAINTHPAVADLVKALETMVYETTHLSQDRDDGSHDCRISKAALNTARSALSRFRELEKANG